MTRIGLVACAVALGLSCGTAALAQSASGQIGPAKTPGGSMPAAPSNSTPQSGSTSGSPMAGAGKMNDNGGQAVPTTGTLSNGTTTARPRNRM